jgi:folate-binding protein YgfZ
MPLESLDGGLDGVRSDATSTGAFGHARGCAMTRLYLHDVHEELGAVFREEEGSEVVAHYGDARTGAIAIRKGAGVVDLSHRGWLRLCGKDRARFLQAMVTNDVLACGPGSGTYAAFLNDKGRVVADAALFVAEDAIYLDVEPAARAKLPGMLDRYIILDDVQVADETPARVLLGVHGPIAREVVSRALGADVPDLPPFGHCLLGRARVVRRDRVGEPGYELYTPLDEASSSLERLRGAGALPVGVDAMEMLRVEAGVPRAFVDMDESTLLLEAGVESAISRTKGCYLGQEVVVRALDRGGVKRILRQLRVKGLKVPCAGASVRHGEREVGRVTSAAPSPTLGVPVALALLSREAWEPGTEVEVAGLPAVVFPLPLGRPRA